MEEVKAWHFVGETQVDGHRVPADGEWIRHDGFVCAGDEGLRASKRLLNAIGQSPEGARTCCRVTCRGIVKKYHDDLFCRERRIDWRVTVDDEVLVNFAFEYIQDIIKDRPVPDDVRKFVETRAENLRNDAEDKAWDIKEPWVRHAALALARHSAMNYYIREGKSLPEKMGWYRILRIAESVVWDNYIDQFEALNGLVENLVRSQREKV